ncbi:adhesin HecA family 20-residue repeat-containing protein [Burkholderia sp. CF099]|nr:adhesin HecA family 20-residue repeat-containing protein [Burkholderia sp. CF099]
MSAASVDNTGGKLTNAGDGATTVTASHITNTGGTLGGTGDVTINSQTLENNAGANLVAGGAANLNVTQRVNNAGGTLYGGTALNLNQAGAAVINDGGAILGGLDVSVKVASLSNAGGAIRANRDVSASGVVSGDGDMVAGRNLALAVNGDYTNDARNNLHADGDMSVSATGTLTNTGTLAANGALTATGANVVNAAGADINSTNTTVNASGTLSNAGRIEGDAVTTHSATLANTGAVIGNDVTVNTNDVQNTGAAAVIAGANSVHVYAQNSVMNADGALIYSAGNLEIAKDGTRDGSGMLANQTGTLTNSAAIIEADGDIDIAAHTVSNVRTGIQTAAGTPQDAGTTALTLWTAGLGSDLSAGVFGNYHSLDFSEWNWSLGAGIGDKTIYALANPITIKVPASQVTNIDASAQTFSLTEPIYDHYQSGATVVARDITTNATQWYNSLTTNADGTVSITFWPDFDPNKNIRPDQAEVRWDIGNHDYVEKSRTTQTTTTTDQLVSAGNVATIQAQGAIRINADGGSISNESSTMAAGGDLIRRADGGSVTDTGTVLQQAVVTSTESVFYWHQKTGGSNNTTEPRNDGKYDGVAQYTTTVDALPAIASSNQNVQTDAQTISINSVDRQGQTVTGSGVTGGSADGTQTGTISGQWNRPQTVGGATGGIPNLKLPVSRDTTNTNGTVSKAPDVNHILDQQADTMQAAQAAGQVVAQGIGAYADAKRDAALDTAQKALDNGDLNGAAAAMADYNNWKEGGNGRAELQAAGGALIGGLGGGSAFGAAAGALGAGLASKMADQTKAFGGSVADATGSSLAGNIAGNILSGLGGALVGGTAGAATASNVNLYNQGHDTGEAAAEKKAAGLTQQLVDTYNNAVRVRQALGDGISSSIDQFVGLMTGGAKAKMAESPSDLIAQGAANGVNAVAGMGGGKPPAQSPGAVLVDGAGQALPGGTRSAAYQPDNATFATDPTSRPSGFRKQTVTDAWNNAANGSADGTKACPTCSKDVTVAPGQGPRDWDIDHQPAWSTRDLSELTTRKQVLDEYNTGTRLECPSCNRSRGANPVGE